MKKMFLLVIALVVMSWGQAFANYSFTYTDTSGVNLSGLLNTSDNGNGSFTVTGGYVTGVLGSDGPINILPGTGQNGNFIWDNLLLPDGTPQLTLNGLLFKDNNNEVNIWGNSGISDYSYYTVQNGVRFAIANDKIGTLTLSAADGPSRSPVPTPIPGAIWLLGTGLVGLVGARRRSSERA